MFASIVAEHWIPRESAASAAGGVRVVVGPPFIEGRSLSLVRPVEGGSVVTVSPERARMLSLTESTRVEPDQLMSRIAKAGIVLDEADRIAYLPIDARDALLAESPPSGTRALTADDAEAFARFAGDAPDDDLDEAFVELDHWLVFGTFADGRLIAVASAYPWRGSPFADVGVITLPGFRGRGAGRATVRAISRAALERGYEPQYRCRPSNAPSVALALAAGFAHYADWMLEAAHE